MNELLEALLYLVSFWRFVFSKRYRLDTLDKFKRLSVYKKCLSILGAIVSVGVGLGIPVIVLVFIIGIPFFDQVDACLDSGGSYNYQQCECDYSVSHSFSKEHQCF